MKKIFGLSDGLKSSTILPNNNFIGRENELNKIHEYLKTSQKVFLHGIGGIGKSEIAKKYANKYKEDYNTIIFSTYQTNLKDMIINDKDFVIKNFERLVGENGVLETDDLYFKRKLEKIKELSNEKTLIIVDNFDVDDDPNLQDFLNGNYHIIITTRNSFDSIGLPIIEIGPMDNREDLLKLFSYNYKKMLKPDEEKIVFDIIDEVQGHTLAIELIAKLMISKRIHPDKMLEMLENEGLNHITGNINHSFNQSITMYDCIKALFNFSVLNDDELKVLENLSLFPISGFDFEEFANLCEIEDCSIIDRLIKKSWISHNIYTDVISMHPLIAEVIRSERNVDLDKCETLFNNLTKICKETWSLDKETRVKYAEVAKAIYNRFQNIELKFSKGYNYISNLFKDSEFFGLAEKIERDLMEVYLKEYGEMSEQVGMTYYELADIFLREMLIQTAIEYFQKSADIMRKVAPISVDTAFVIKFLASAYKEAGVLDHRKELLEESRKIYEQTVEENNPHMASQYSAEARFYIDEGKDLDKALELAKKSYDIFYKLNGEVHMDTSSPMRVMARVHYKRQEYEEAINIQKRIIEIVGTFCDENSNTVLKEEAFLADIYIDAKMYKEAYNILTKIKEVLEMKHNTKVFLYTSVIEKLEKIKDKV